VDDTCDNANETLDEPDEYCYSNPRPPGLAVWADIDQPFDGVDEWELLQDRAFPSRLEVLMASYDLDGPFAPGTALGSYRRNLTTLSADAQWVGTGAADVADRLQVRVDLNRDTIDEIKRAFRQAGFPEAEVRQLAVNLQDSRDTDDNVTQDADDLTVFGHEREPFINEVFFATWRPPGWGPPPGHGPPDGSGWTGQIGVAIELYNPYDTDIDLYQWEVRVDIEGASPDSRVLVIDDGAGNSRIPAHGYLTLISTDPDAAQGGLQLDVEGKVIVLADQNFMLWPKDNHVYRIRLVRGLQIGQGPGGGNGQLVVDDTASAIDFNVLDLPALTMPGHPGQGGPPGPPPDAEWWGLDLYRRDAEVNVFEASGEQHPEPTLGEWNIPAEATTRPPRYAVPIPNDGEASFGSVADLGQLLNFTQNGSEPYTDDYALITSAAATTKELGIKFDLTGDWYAGGADNPNRRLLDLVCVNRPDRDGLDNDGDGTVDEADEAEWPVYGRLNINTASQAMLERALWRGPYPTPEAKDTAAILAHEIDKHRETVGPFRHIGDLFASPDLAAAMAYWARDSLDNDGDGSGAEAGEEGEKDERDACFRCLCNLVTTRSNVFTVFVTVEVYRDLNDNGTIEEGEDERLASRKAVAILDRSRAGMQIKVAGGVVVPHATSGVVEHYFRWISE
jgi:hypothetical protein